MKDADTTSPGFAKPGQYLVLARKYRPLAFTSLIGQDALVTTLTNAFQSGRLAHAYMLTGVRGVGKTTTARIIARAINCVGTDGSGGPTANPCGVCEPCVAIAEDRHIDVLEMDAASHTGIDDIRELIDGVPYRPVSARFKVYIIDEVHMLSKQAFNALLKTLEEPPDHVKFVFATTEIRKVPVTVLSRCQRFDLRRVDTDAIARHFADIVAEEGASISEAALQLIARAADGSVRDGLSLLDQAISHSAGSVDENAVREILGLADRTALFDLFEATMRGEIATALSLLDHQYQSGADPAVVVSDLLDLTHWLTRVKVVAATAEAAGVPEAERVRGKAIADGLSMAALTRAWQMLLKGLGEVQIAPSPLQAVEMVLVRLAYASRLPTPTEALQAMQRADAGPPSVPTPGPTISADPPSVPTTVAVSPIDPSAPKALRVGAAPEAAMQPMAVPGHPDPICFEDVIELAHSEREAVLYGHLVTHARLVRFEPGQIDLRLEDDAPSDLAQRLSRFLKDQTGRHWLVGLSREPGQAPVLEQRQSAEAALVREAAEHTLVKAIIETFPGATIEAVRPLTPAIDGEVIDGDVIDGDVPDEPQPD